MGSNNNNPITGNLHYKKPGHSRDWLKNKPIEKDCPTPRAGLGECDEYSFASSEEGGKINHTTGNVSLRMINGPCNRQGGCFLSQMLIADNTKSGDPYRVFALPTAQNSLYITRKGRFKIQ